MHNNLTINQASLNGSKDEVIAKLLNLKNSKALEDEQSFVDALVGFVSSMTTEKTEYIMVTINTLNGKIDQVIVGIGDLKEGMRDQFKLVHQRLDGVDKRLDGVDKRLDGLDGRLKSVEEDTKIIRTVVSGAKKVGKIFKR
ncbi:MAG: hypothetical protein IJ187_10375 [Neisseriaceae bacterium]|nr:hypothetical protein [Neisseriaceae bacterium]MBQ9723948.1 hypothetical protein [Neisseriaceae bacterium]